MIFNAISGDLASVSKLLTNASGQNFQQYFQSEQPVTKRNVSESEVGDDADADADADADDAECTSSDAQSNSDEAGHHHGDDGEQVIQLFSIIFKQSSSYFIDFNDNYLIFNCIFIDIIVDIHF